MRRQEDLDQLLKEAVQENIDSIEVPYLDDVWSNIEDNINKKDNGRIAILNKRVASVIAAVLALVVIYSTTDEGYAYYRRFLSFVTNTIENKIDIGSKQNTPPNPKIDENLVLTTESLSIKDAIQQATFDIRIPTYEPIGYSIDEIILTHFGGETLRAEILYISEDSKLIKLEQEPIIGDYAQTIQIDPDRTKVSNINENGINYNLIEASDGEVMVVWDFFGTKFTAIGFDKEEILNLIFSIE